MCGGGGGTQRRGNLDRQKQRHEQRDDRVINGERKRKIETEEGVEEETEILRIERG